MLGFVALAKIALGDDQAERNYTLTADAGSFALTGQTAALQFGDNFVASEGSFALTGSDASLTKSMNVSAQAGSFSSAGNDATFTVQRAFAADAGDLLCPARRRPLQSRLTRRSISLIWRSLLRAEQTHTAPETSILSRAPEMRPLPLN